MFAIIGFPMSLSSFLNVQFSGRLNIFHRGDFFRFSAVLNLHNTRPTKKGQSIPTLKIWKIIMENENINKSKTNTNFKKPKAEIHFSTHKFMLFVFFPNIHSRFEFGWPSLT
jgi:hypothetical protein